MKKYKCAILDDKTIRLCEEEVGIYPVQEDKLLNPKLTHHKDGTLTIEGDLINYKLCFNAVTHNLEKYSDTAIFTKKRLFSKKKYKYVKSGWNRLKETTKLKKRVSEFEIIY